MRAFRGIGKCVCVCERGREGASKKLMDWCALFFFFFFLLALGQGYFYIRAYVLANERVHTP